MGFLIAIEGVDGSGKQTQTKELKARLEGEGYPVASISFPDYTSPASSLVKMYLMGEFGRDARDVDAYQASTFFAADRFASWRRGTWRSIYEAGGIVLADRYTTANMVHQAGKLQRGPERTAFLEWLCDLEYRLYGIPKPDLVFFLDVPLAVQRELVRQRRNKITGENLQDIHEKDVEHLRQAHKAALEVAECYHWVRIDCVQDGTLRSIENIAQEIYQKTLETLTKRGLLRAHGQTGEG
ncbi:Thymidylate kinase [Clostridiaceae bacterium JG1575]|nr:Thymidylate kinase [Clostridiaceae bacterium JG1575]